MGGGYPGRAPSSSSPPAASASASATAGSGRLVPRGGGYMGRRRAGVAAEMTSVARGQIGGWVLVRLWAVHRAWALCFSFFFFFVLSLRLCLELWMGRSRTEEEIRVF